MHDTLVRDALLSHAANEPPMTFTSSDMIRAGRRSRALHRGAWAGSVLAVTLLAGAGLALAPTGSSPPIPTPVALPPGTPLWTTLDSAAFCAAAAAPAEPAIEPASVVNPKNGFSITIPTEPADHAAARFSCYLMQAVPQLMPGAAFARDPNSPAQTVPLQAFASRVLTRTARSTPPLRTSRPTRWSPTMTAWVRLASPSALRASPSLTPSPTARASAASGPARTARLSPCSRSSRTPATAS